MADGNTVPPNAPVGTTDKTPPPKRTRPSKPIPTERLKMSKQLDILRAFAAAGGNGKPVANTEIAKMVSMAETTTSLANFFFTETGLLVKAQGGLMPSADVVAYGRAYEWDAATAAHKLAPTIRRTWFAEALLPKLAFRPMDETAVVNVLAEASAAEPAYRPNLELLIDYLESAGLVVHDGTEVRISRQTQPTEHEAPAPPSVQPADVQRPSATTPVSAPPAGGIQFAVNVNVDMAELSGWSPERITAFFGGVAKVLAAKGGMVEPEK